MTQWPYPGRSLGSPDLHERRAAQLAARLVVSAFQTAIELRVRSGQTRNKALASTRFAIKPFTIAT